MFPYSENTVAAKDATPLFVRRWAPEQTPTHGVMFVHGGAEHAGRYEHMARDLVTRGAVVLGHDHRGQGRSGGIRGHVHDFSEYVNDALVVAREYGVGAFSKDSPFPWFIYAHSMGGLITTLLLSEHAQTLGLRGAIISSPFFALKAKVNPLKILLGNLTARIVPTLAVPTGLPDNLICRDEHEVKKYATDPLRVRAVTTGWFAALKRAHQQAQENVSSITLPMLWYYGTGDLLVSPEAVVTTFAKLKNPRQNDQQLQKYEGYYHELHNEPEALRRPVLERAYRWIDERR